MRIKDLSQTLGCNLTDPIMDATEDNSDPANVDPELAEKLLKNHTIAKQKMDEVTSYLFFFMDIFLKFDFCL